MVPNVYLIHLVLIEFDVSNWIVVLGHYVIVSKLAGRCRFVAPGRAL